MRGRDSTLPWTLVAALLASVSGLILNVTSDEVLARRWWKGPLWLLILLIVLANVLVGLIEHWWKRRSNRMDDPSGPARSSMVWEGRESIDRRRLMVRVSGWVTAGLERSLHQAALTAAAPSRSSPTSDDPLISWNLARLQNGQREPIPAETPIIEIFDKLGGGMLLLGEPGAGKTTLLLQLARDLLDRAKGDDRAAPVPVPVVFNLGSWSSSRSLEAWMADGLYALYDVPVPQGRYWIEAERIMPLLDGLDEVKANERWRCVDAINAYRRRHGMNLLAVTCRTTAAGPVLRRLRMQGIIELGPPTPSQIAAYLDGVGIQMPSIRAALQHDTTLQRLLASPLVLSIVALAYRHRSGTELLRRGSPYAWREHLFKVYVREMLSRRQVPAGHGPQPYRREEVERYLGWLARVLRLHRPPGGFRLDLMQPQWLPSRAHRFAATWGLTLSAAVAATAIAGATAWFLYDVLDPYFGLPRRGPLLGFPAWLSTAVGVGMGVGVLMHGDHVQPADELQWSWRELRRRLPRRSLQGVLIGLTAGTVAWSTSGRQLLGGSAYGIATGLLASVLFLLIGGFRPELTEEPRALNEGMRRTRRTILLGSLPVALPFGLLTALLYGASFEPLVGLVAGLHTTMAIWVVAGLWAGGRDYLRHLAVRLLLWRAGLAPRDYAGFLEDAVDRLLLQRVGTAGYQFVHPLLLDYFAQQNGSIARPGPPRRRDGIRRIFRSFRWRVAANVIEALGRAPTA